jgi:hypothetical protein
LRKEAEMEGVTRTCAILGDVVIDRSELDRRLVEADRCRRALRRATLEWQELGRRVLQSRDGSDDAGSGRPDGRSPRDH